MQTERKPITIEDLAPELQKMVKAKASNAVQKIQYELPKVKTPTIPKSKIPEFAKVVDDLMLGNPVMLIGGAGRAKRLWRRTWPGHWAGTTSPSTAPNGRPPRKSLAAKLWTVIRRAK